MEKITLTQLEIKHFVEEYSEGNIDSEVLSNVLHRILRAEHNITFSANALCFLNLFKYDNDTPLAQLFMFSSKIQKTMLEKEYGQCDFEFEGNRIYSNYLFKHNDLIFIMSDKSEYIHPPRTRNVYQNVIDFMMLWQQELINFLSKNQTDPSFEFISKHLVSAQNSNQLDENYQIMYDNLVPVTIITKSKKP